MRKTSLLFFALVFFSSTKSQNAYYDALTITKAYYSNNDSISKIALGLLNKYRVELKEIPVSKFKETLQNNIQFNRDSVAKFILENTNNIDQFNGTTELKKIIQNLKQLQEDSVDIYNLNNAARANTLLEFAKLFDKLDKKKRVLKIFIDSLKVKITSIEKQDLYRQNIKTISEKNYLKLFVETIKKLNSKRNFAITSFDRRYDSVIDSSQLLQIDIIDSIIQVAIIDLIQKESNNIKQKFNANFEKLKTNIFETEEIKGLVIDYIRKNSSDDAFNMLKYSAQSNASKVSNAVFEINNSNPDIQRLSNFKIPSQAQIIDGLAIYVTNRVKQETVILFTEMLKDSIKDNALLMSLFPNTLSSLTSWDGNVSPKFGSGWRYAISKDLTLMPDHILNYMGKHGSGKNYLNTLRDGLTIARLVQAKYNFIEMIDFFAVEKDTIKSESLQKFASLTYIINNELFAIKDSLRYWVSFREFNNRTADSVFLKVFTALLLNKHKPSLQQIFGQEKYADLLKAPDSLRNFLNKVLLQFEHFQKNQYQFINKNDGDFSVANYLTMISNIIQQIISDKIFPVNDKTAYRLTDAINNINKIFEIYNLFEEKNYAAAAHASVNLVFDFVKFNEKRKLFFTDISKDLTLLNTLTRSNNIASSQLLIDSINQKNVLSFVDTAITNFRFELLEIKKHISNFDTLQAKKLIQNLVKKCDSISLKDSTTIMSIPLAFLRRFTNFTSDVLKAKDDASLAKVINAYALPPASYRIRLRHKYVIDLGAYLGVYTANEWVANPTTNKYSNSKIAFGLTAPIGFNYSWRNKSKKTYHTFSLGILDIVAAVSYRFANPADSVSQLPSSINFAQVFSPSFFYRKSIPKTPLVWYTGIQLAPQIRSFKNLGESTALRFALGVAIDMPMFILKKR